MNNAAKCDGYGCKKRCAETMTPAEWEQYCCHYTTDPSHYIDGFQSIDILMYIAAVFVFISFIIILWPEEKTDAAEKLYYSVYVMEKPEHILMNQFDMDKEKEVFISSPKDIYETKAFPVYLQVWKYLTGPMGLSDIQAAGIFGNMMVECGSRSFNLQPYVYSPGGAYYGLCQWGTGNHHRSINGGTIEEQLEYLASTIRGEMGEYGYSAFEGSTDPESAADCFARWYERCSNPSGRRSEARRAYERFARE